MAELDWTDGRRHGSQSRHSVLLAVGLAVSLTAAACTHGSSNGTSSGPGPIRSSAVKKLSGNELLYGAGAVPNKRIVYQPDVVMIGGGAAAVRAVSGSGLTWTMDANAPGASRLAVGKIMLATSFGTGRVLSLTKTGSEDTVVLGPVAITDVIRDADIGSSSPIPLEDMLAYTTPTRPGAAVADTQDPVAVGGPANPGTSQAPGAVSHSSYRTRRHSAAGAALAQPAVFRATPRQGSAGLPAPSTVPTTVGAGDFQVTPICCHDLGLRIGYKKGDGVLVATVKLNVGRPTVTFRLVITGGQLQEATFQVNGGGALTVDIDAATLTSLGSFKGTAVEVPEHLTIPLIAFGAPLSLTISQHFYLSMQLIGAASFHTKGGYKVSGSLGFGYRNGGPTGNATTVAVQDPFTANTDEVGVASGVITLGWQLKTSIGLGLLGFTAGPWYALGFALSVTADGISLTAGCVTDALAVTGSYGIGYTIPKVVAAVINLFLKVIHAQGIPSSGGPSWGPTDLLHPPPANYCRKRPGA